MSLNDRIHWNCSECGQPYRSPRQSAGKQTVCRCGRELTIPVPDQPVDEAEPVPAPEIRSYGSERAILLANRIPWNCPECDQYFKTPSRLAGKEINCGGCNAIVRVPVPEVNVPAPGRLRWACGHCDLIFQTTPQLAGQIIECPSCQVEIPVPDGSE